jgi:lipoate---protein ligase
MHELLHLDLTLPTPAENLACDEALLDWCDGGGSNGGVLRFWEPPQHFVVLGYANKAGAELDVEACRSRQIPILRRCSGGGAVLQGPGCLNYTLVLKIDEALRSITETNCLVMKRNAAALSALLGAAVTVEGFTDLALNNLKFSGNAQRRKRHFLLFHGTFLLDFDLELLEKLLLPPSKQPAYRRNRSHAEFRCCLQRPAE